MSGKIADVTDIEFHEGYVVVKDRGGHGRALCSGRTRGPNWSDSKQ